MKSYTDRVFGSKSGPLISPLHALCLEIGCSTPVISLKNFNDLTCYMRHLATHTEKAENNDESFSFLMHKRLKGSHLFSTETEIDKICPIQPCLAPMGFVLEKLRRSAIAYRIERDFEGNFVAKWLSMLFENNIIDTDHIIYQEFSALLQTALSFPNPVRNWEEHRTLFLHSLAMYTSTPLLTYELMRGNLMIEKYKFMNGDQP